MVPQTDPDNVETERPVESSPRFQEVDLEDIEGRRILAPLRPATALLLFALLLASGAYVVVRSPDSLSVLGRELHPLSWLYGLSVLFVALVVAPRFLSFSIGDTLDQLVARPLTLVSGLIAVAVVLVGTVAPSVFSEPSSDVLISLQPPAWRGISEVYVPTCHGPVVDGQCQGTTAHLLGTTAAGEDLLIVSLLGLNTTIQVAFTSTVIAATLGIGVGIVAGYTGGRTDELLMRYVDTQRALPSFFVYVLSLLVFERSFSLLILVFGLLSWGGIARLVRSEVVQLRTTSYIQAAQLSGADTWFVVRRHVLPTVTTTIITTATLLFAKFALYEAALSFLALTPESVASLGNELALAIGQESADVTLEGDGQLYDWWQTPWLVYVPGGILFVLVLTVTVAGDGLQDLFDARS